MTVLFKKKSIFFFIVYFLLLLIVFRDLLFNFTTNLIDWLDYPFMIWQIYQSVEKISHLQFSNFFETNAFYPSRMTLLFSNLFLPEAFFATFLNLFAKNVILVFNIIYLTNFILDYIALFLFWKQIFNNEVVSFFGAIFIIFSPFFHQNRGLPQMYIFWPFFFSLYFFLKFNQIQDKKFLFFSGFFYFLQFVSSVYLAVFLGVVFGVFFTVDFLWVNRKRINVIFTYLVIGAVFFIFSFPFIKGYLYVKRLYAIKKEIKGAQLSDYIFTKNINTILYQLPIIKRWNSFYRPRMVERAAFPGFLLTSLALFGIITLKRRRQVLEIAFRLSALDLKFILVSFLGFWFSLGPRLFFNGLYANMPTGVNVLVKVMPLLTFIRAAARWSFLFYLGIVYFALKALKKIVGQNTQKKRAIILFFISFFFILEYVPFGIKTHKDTYITSFYRKLKNECKKKKKVLLEYPITHLNVKGGIISGVKYISKVILASSYHKCYLINGYSGYDPMYLRQLHWSLSTEAREKDAERVEKLIRKYQVDFLKINTDKVIDPKVVEGWYEVKSKIRDAEIYIEKNQND